MENNIYRHPERQGKPQTTFKTIHDLSALGIVLLEIGLWKPAVELLGKLRENGTPKEISER